MPGDQTETYATEPCSAHWGPWSTSACDAKRLCDTNTLRLLASIKFGRAHPLARALLRAETIGDDALGARAEALLEANLELERLPALDRRHLLASYAKHAGLEPTDRPARVRTQRNARKPALAGAA